MIICKSCSKKQKRKVTMYRHYVAKKGKWLPRNLWECLLCGRLIRIEESIVNGGNIEVRQFPFGINR